MMVALRLLAPTSDRRQPAIIGFIILLLQLPPLAAACWFGHLYRRLLRNIQLIATEQSGTAICKLGALRDRA
jgi:hypothetical protein